MNSAISLSEAGLQFPRATSRIHQHQHQSFVPLGRGKCLKPREASRYPQACVAKQRSCCSHRAKAFLEKSSGRAGPETAGLPRTARAGRRASVGSRGPSITAGWALRKTRQVRWEPRFSKGPFAGSADSYSHNSSPAQYFPIAMATA